MNATAGEDWSEPEGRGSRPSRRQARPRTHDVPHRTMKGKTREGTYSHSKTNRLTSLTRADTTTFGTMRCDRATGSSKGVVRARGGNDHRAMDETRSRKRGSADDAGR